MDAARFDALVRSINMLAPRRAALGALGGGLAALLGRLGIEDIEAKKKKKKKKCKPCRKKKKGKCKGKKPDGTPCGGENVCLNGQCVPPTCDPPCVAPQECVAGVCTCPSGTIPCDDECIDDALCCTDDDCGPDQTCESGTCTCPGGLIPCGAECIEEDQCCADADCGGDILTCEDNVCTCPDPSDLPCSASDCCDPATDEVCDEESGECLSGCPTTDFCAVENTFFCDFECACATSIDDANVCTDFLIGLCGECATDAECTTALGQDAVCIPNGEFCDFCELDPASFCVATGCPSGAPLRSKNAAGSFRKGELKLKR